MISTKTQFAEFLSSTVWRDIKDMLLVRRSEIRDQLEGGANVNTDVFVEMRETARLRGRAEELRYITDLPQDVVENFDEYTKEADNGR